MVVDSYESSSWDGVRNPIDATWVPKTEARGAVDRELSMTGFASPTYSSKVFFPTSHSAPALSVVTSAFRNISILRSSSNSKSICLQHLDRHCCAPATARIALKKSGKSIVCFRVEDDHEHKTRNPGKKQTQEALLKRIAYEVRQKRDGDRESTPLVRALTWACRGAKVPADVNVIVADLELGLPIFTSAIQKLGIERNPQAAVAVFGWLQSGSGRLPNVFTYNSLLGALKANGWFETAHSTFYEMQVNGVIPDVVTYNTLISLYEQQGRLDDALEVFRWLRPRGVHPTVFTYRNVTQIFAKKGDVESALSLLQDFRSTIDSKTTERQRDLEQRQQLEMDMTQLCCERFSVLLSQDPGNGAVTFYNILKRAQVQMNAQAYERLIRACGERQDDYKIVQVLYGDVRDQQLHLSVSACNHVIIVCGRGKKWWAALEVYENMVEDGPEPDATTYRLILSHFQVLLNAARKKRSWKWALQLLDKMIEKGVEPDTFAWNAALIACAKAGETAAAVLVFQKMTERGERPGILSYGALLSALEKSSFLPAAELLWDHMHKLGLKPNIVAYTTMITLYGKVGRYSDAKRLMDDMREAGIEPSLITFNALITSCARAGDGERAIDLVEQMKAAWIQPDAVTYAQLIEALANEGRWEPALAAYAKMQELQLEAPTSAYNAVVRVCKANNVYLHLQPSAGS